MTFRPMPILTALSALSLVILMLLGTWQYQRYSEKMAAPVEEVIEEVAERLNIDINLDHSGNIQQLYGFADSEPIWRRYAPGTLNTTGEAVLVMVEATGGAQPVPAAISTLPENVTYEGHSRAQARPAPARSAPMMRSRNRSMVRAHRRQNACGVILVWRAIHALPNRLS